MQNIFKIAAMFVVLTTAVIASMFVLDVISLDVARETGFKITFIILIFSISSLLISFLSTRKKSK